MSIQPRVILFFCFMCSFCDGFSAERDPNYDRIVQHLASNIELLNKNAVREELSPTEVWAEAETQWQEVMQRYRETLAKRGWGDRKDLIESKQKVFDAWKRQCRVLLDLMDFSGAKVHRYDEGKNGSTGYVVVQNGVPKYWLHTQFNRERDRY